MYAIVVPNLIWKHFDRIFSQLKKKGLLAYVVTMATHIPLLYKKKNEILQFIIAHLHF